ncbi:MAG: nuclear transport factor 2 family protein [Rhizomicrobium sp.]
MKTVVEAWGQADFGPIRDAIDDNIIWKSASIGQGAAFRFGGVYNGKVEVMTLLSELSANYFFQRYTAKEIISKGDIVWGLFDSYGNYIPSGGRKRKSITLETVFRWRIRGGKIVEAQTFFDTAALLAQQEELLADCRVA